MHIKKRFFIETVQHIAKKLELRFEATFGGWLITLTNSSGVTKRILGYTFPVNDASTAAILKDKAALSSLLHKENIPHIHHELLLTPAHTAFIGEDGNSRKIEMMVSKYGYPLVLKPNTGTGGEGLYLINKTWELERALLQLFTQERAVAVAPFYEIEAEYRVIVLGDTVLLSFGKKVPLGGWQHNLSKGGSCFDIKDTALQKELHIMGINTLAQVGASLGAVDIVQTKRGLKVLEVNGGISLEKVSQLLPSGKSRCFDVYNSIIRYMFDVV